MPKEGRYKRGPYKRTSTITEKPIPIYRSKIRTEENTKDCVALFEKLRKFKQEIKDEFGISYNRSKIIENTQGLMDMLGKQIKKHNEIIKEAAGEEILQLQQRLKELEDKIERNQNQEKNIFSELELDIEHIDFSEFEPILTDSSINKI